MRELKKINFEDKKFTANGNVYYIEQSLTQDRWKEWRKLQVELAYDMTYDILFEKLKLAYTHLNKPHPEPADCAVILHNIMYGLKGAMEEKRTPLVLQLCSLFMNTADEDRTVITEQMIDKKTEDWRIEGIDMNSFFLFALNSIPNFIPSYNSIIQSILQKDLIPQEENPET